MTAEEKVRDLIGKTGMLKDGDRVIAAVSGGADSVFLFFVLLDLTHSMRLGLTALHVHHGIRGEEADRDARFVRALCGAHGIPCTTVERDVPAEARLLGMSVEEAGRKARYEALRAEAERLGGAKIALAHHRDDLAETVLFRIARGTGIRGLASMRPVNGPLIRPLLGVTRAEIEESLRQRDISWMTDSTNRENDAARNRIRHILLPLLEEHVNSRAADHLADLARRAGEAADFIAAEAAGRLGLHASFSGGACLLRGTVLEEYPAVRKEIFRICLDRTGGSVRDVTERHLEDLGGLFGKKTDARLDLPHGVEAVRRREGVELKRRERTETPREDAAPERRPGIEIPGTFPFEADFGAWRFSCEIEAFPSLPVPQKKYTKWFDYDKINGTAVIRTRRSGDFIAVNAAGGRKKLSDYFTDQKVPSRLRDGIPLLAVGSEILWVVGMRDSCGYRIDGTTERALRVRAYSNDKGADYE